MSSPRHAHHGPPAGTRVSVVDDHGLLAELLVRMLAGEGYEARVVELDELRSTAQVLTATMRQRPRVAVVDLNLDANRNGVALIEPLTQRGVLVVVVTASADHAVLGECFARGAVGVVSKGHAFSQLADVVSKALSGQPTIAPEQLTDLLASYEGERESSAATLRGQLDSLTLTEALILGQLMAGANPSEIARSRVISEATVRTQIRNLLRKLEAPTTLAAVARARQAQWAPPSS